VLASLDQLKKTSVEAREAIRWLEEELQRGNRVIKYPKDFEKLSLSPIKYPKRKDKEACDYYELLEYCNYLNKNTRTGERKPVYGMPMVTLLTHSFNKWPANAEAVAKTSGIFHDLKLFEFIINFEPFFLIIFFLLSKAFISKQLIRLYRSGKTQSKLLPEK
jgi:hypothetical protein